MRALVRKESPQTVRDNNILYESIFIIFCFGFIERNFAVIILCLHFILHAIKAHAHRACTELQFQAHSIVVDLSIG